MKVFISANSRDLALARMVAAKAIERIGFESILIEEKVRRAIEQSPEVVKSYISKADVFLLIMMSRYGSANPGTDTSWSQMEYEMAKAAGKPTLVFAQKEHNPSIPFGKTGPITHILHEQENEAEFRFQIEHDRSFRTFESLDELATQIMDALNGTKLDKGTHRDIGESDPDDTFQIKFAPGLSAHQIQATLEALADYYRACGGVGLQSDFELADVLIAEPADVVS